MKRSRTLINGLIIAGFTAFCIASLRSPWIFWSVSASLCTPKNSSRAFSDRNAQALFRLQLVSSACTTSEWANSVHKTSNSFCQCRASRCNSATAWHAAPSPRPANPRWSVVEARTVTWERSTDSAPASRSRIAPRYGASRGSWATPWPIR